MAGTRSSGRPSVTAQTAVRGEQVPPDMPEDLVGEHAQKLWKIACESLPHVLRPLDFAVLRLCCMAYQSAIDLHEAGESKEASNVSRTFESLAAKIGLTPSSRRVVKPVENSDDDQDGDAFAEWLKKGRLN